MVSNDHVKCEKLEGRREGGGGGVSGHGLLVHAKNCIFGQLV